MWQKIKHFLYHKKGKGDKVIYRVLGIRLNSKKKQICLYTDPPLKKFTTGKNTFYTQNSLFIENVPSIPPFFNSKRPNVQKIKNGIILPPKAAENKSYKGGVVDDKGRFIWESGRYRDLNNTRMENTLFDSYSTDKIDFVNESVIYVGDLINHWGHFLVEGTVRLWYPLTNRSNIKIVYTLYSNSPLEKNILEFLKLCDFHEKDIYFLTKPIQFKEVIVPEMSSIFLNYYTDQFMVPFDFLIKKIPAQNIDKIYFSRRKFQLRPIVGEDRLEKLFAQLGYKIIYPEKLTLSQMISLLKGAKSVAGLTGTGIHNILFANKDIHLIALVRALEKGTNNIKAQLEINEAREIQATFLDANFDFLNSSTGPYLVGITQAICQYMKDEKLFSKIQPTQFSKHEIKKFTQLWLKENFPYHLVK